MKKAKKKPIHYAIKHRGELWTSACGLPYWVDVELWTSKRRVTCKRCRKTKAFKVGRRASLPRVRPQV